MTPAEAVANAEAVVLDFDGPMCDVFAAMPAPDVARELAAFAKEVWFEHGDSLEGQLPDTDDPFEVLRAATSKSAVKAGHVSVRLRQLETKAIEAAPATAGLFEFLSLALGRGQIIAVASNNSVGAIKRWLEIHDLGGQFSYIAGRKVRSDQLKPDPFVLQEALAALDRRADRCVFIGDSLSDLEAARAVPMPFVAFADKPQKPARFREKGSELVITGYDQLGQDIESPT